MGKQKKYLEYRNRQNVDEFNIMKRKLERIIFSMFKWENLPDGVPFDWLEKTLAYNGAVCVHDSNYSGVQFSKCNELDRNCYDMPIHINVYDNTGFSKVITKDKCILIYGDIHKAPYINIVNYYAKRLTNIEKTIDCNLEQLKTPTIFTCPDEQIESAKQIWRQKSEGLPVIFGVNGLGGITWESLDCKAVNHLESLYRAKIETVNEFLNMFGINTVQTIKKERLITQEAEQNNEVTTIFNNSMLETRLEAVKEINSMFGLDINVSYNKDLGGVIHGNLYNSIT